VKNAPSPTATARGVSTSSGNNNNRTTVVSDGSAPSQASTQQLIADEEIHIGAIWKSPRDKRACIEGKIKSFNDSPPYFDLRILEMDAQGRMRPTHKGVTVSMACLPALAKLVGDAMRKASAAGLLTAVST